MTLIEPIVTTPNYWITSVKRPYGIYNSTVELKVVPHDIKKYPLAPSDLLNATKVGISISELEERWKGNADNWYSDPTKDICVMGIIPEEYDYVLVNFSLNLQSKIILTFHQKHEKHQ